MKFWNSHIYNFESYFCLFQDSFLEVQLSKLQKVHEEKGQLCKLFSLIVKVLNSINNTEFYIKNLIIFCIMLVELTAAREGRMLEESVQLQKCKNKTDEVLKVMGQRLGILSIHLLPPTLEPQVAAKMQELSALKTTLYEIFISPIYAFLQYCVSKWMFLFTNVTDEIKTLFSFISDEAGHFINKLRYRKDNQRRAKKHYSLMLQATVHSNDWGDYLCSFLLLLPVLKSIYFESL